MTDSAANLPQRLIHRDEYELLGANGAFEDEDVELLDGRIVYAAEEGPAHAAVCARLNRLLVEAIPGPVGEVRVGNPYALSDLSMPEPDFLVTEPRYSTRTAHPSTASLVIEVARSSRATDLGLKAALYAAAGVPDYWVVDLVRDLVVVHRDPDAMTFRTITSHDRQVPAPLHHPGVAVDLLDLLR
ncbi:MAG TPA: Uma2 family endonuclease [Euzebya sp.]|nr:Uma2 family endonuclease [Euzebya sp.]